MDARACKLQFPAATASVDGTRRRRSAGQFRGLAASANSFRCFVMFGDLQCFFCRFDWRRTAQGVAANVDGQVPHGGRFGDRAQGGVKHRDGRGGKAVRQRALAPRDVEQRVVEAVVHLARENNFDITIYFYKNNKTLAPRGVEKHVVEAVLHL